jgi:phosphoglycolate phosphatase
VSALLLDLDRTLVDVQSFTDYEAACRELDEEFGEIALVDMPESGWRSATHRAMATLFSLSGVSDDWKRADAIVSRHELAVIDEATSMPYLKEFLDATRELPRAVVTLMGQTPAEEICDRFEIDIPVVVGRRVDLRPKPAPDQLVAGLVALGVVATGTTMVGDSPWDSDAAIAAGTRFVGLSNDRASVFPRETLVVGDLREALDLFV